MESQNEKDYMEIDLVEVLLENEKDYTEIDLVEVFHVILDNARNIFVVTLCCTLIAVGYVFLQPKAAVRYESQALVRVRLLPNTMQVIGLNDLSQDAHPLDKTMTNTVSNLGYGMLYLNQRLLTYAELLKSNVILSPVNEAIKILFQMIRHQF